MECGAGTGSLLKGVEVRGEDARVDRDEQDADVPDAVQVGEGDGKPEGTEEAVAEPGSQRQHPEDGATDTHEVNPPRLTPVTGRGVQTGGTHGGYTWGVHMGYTRGTHVMLPIIARGRSESNGIDIKVSRHHTVTVSNFQSID